MKGNSGTRTVDKTHRMRIASVAPEGSGTVGYSAYKDALSQLGHDKNDIDAAFRLIDSHGGNSSQQEYADPLIYRYINDPKSPIGAVLRDISGIEEYRFKKQGTKTSIDKRVKEVRENQKYSLLWNDELKTDKDRDRYLDSHGFSVRELRERFMDYDIQVYRGGARKNVEAWTTDSKGANTGSVRIGIEHKSSILQMLKTHYILGGLGFMVGAPGESEILFVKKK